jgi:hypothetical protein
LLQHFLGAAFADACDAGVGLDRHHQIALIEQRIRLGRRVHAHAGDLGFGDGGERGWRLDGDGRGYRGKRTKKGSAG